MVFFASFASLIADVRTFTAGTALYIPSIGAEYVATESTGNLGQTNASGQEINVVSGNTGISAKAFGVIADGTTDDTAAMVAADAAANTLGCVLLLPDGSIKINSTENYLLFTSSWVGSTKTKLLMKNIQWLGKDEVTLRNIRFWSSADRSTGTIAGYSDAYTTKSGVSGCVDLGAVTTVIVENCRFKHTDGGTANLLRMEGCQDVAIWGNHFLNGGCSIYGNKQNQLEAPYSISDANTAANLSYANIADNKIDGGYVNDFDLVNFWGGVSGSITGNTIINSNFDGMDLYSSGERVVVSNNVLKGISRIGIQTKFDTGATSRDSDGAGKNEYVTIANNVITDVGPLSTDPTTSVGNVSYIAGIYVLWGDSENEFPTPTVANMLRCFVISGNQVVNIHDDDDMADADCVNMGIICDAYFTNISNNLVTGVRRAPNGTNSVSGTALGIAVIDTCATQGVSVSDNVFSADRIGVYINGQTRSGTVHDITLTGNKYINDAAQASSTLSLYAVFLTPSLSDIKCYGETFDDIQGQGYHVRSSNIDIDNATIDAGNAQSCVFINDTISNISVTNCKMTSTNGCISLNADDTKFDGASENWNFSGNTCNDDFDIRVDNACTGSLQFLRIQSNNMLSGARILVGGYDVSTANKIQNIQINSNSGHDFTDHFIDLARLERGQVNMNHGGTASSVNLVRASNSCDYLVAALNTATSGAGLIVNLGNGSNNTTVSNVTF
jgi:hypothetical protein